ncbi:MAG: hypothetical protein V4687_15970 [Bacteroidota bacterium]
MPDKQKPENPPAFPYLSMDGDTIYRGLSMRDYFAAKAMHGILNSDNWRDLDLKMESGLSIVENIASHSYKIADAMLKARQQ